MAECPGIFLAVRVVAIHRPVAVVVFVVKALAAAFRAALVLAAPALDFAAPAWVI
jgi:hypothetical protein